MKTRIHRRHHRERCWCPGGEQLVGWFESNRLDYCCHVYDGNDDDDDDEHDDNGNDDNGNDDVNDQDGGCDYVDDHESDENGDDDDDSHDEYENVKYDDEDNDNITLLLLLLLLFDSKMLYPSMH